MNADADIVVRLEHVTRVYQHDSQAVRALDGIDLEIRSGDFAVLVGPSGSGKTTLLNLIGGLDSPTAGRIWVSGTETGRMSKAELSQMRLRKIGFVFQEFNLIPVLSALENVEFVLLLQGVARSERRAKAMRFLEELGLGELAHKRPGEMSGGQQQRVAVARAIASEPEIVLADEPTANLDSKTAEDLLGLMLQMNQDRGVTFLFSTHDPRVMAHARRIVRLVDGKIASDERRVP